MLKNLWFVFCWNCFANCWHFDEMHCICSSDRMRMFLVQGQLLPKRFGSCTTESSNDLFQLPNIVVRCTGLLNRKKNCTLFTRAHRQIESIANKNRAQTVWLHSGFNSIRSAFTTRWNPANLLHTKNKEQLSYGPSIHNYLGEAIVLHVYYVMKRFRLHYAADFGILFCGYFIFRLNQTRCIDLFKLKQTRSLLHARASTAGPNKN